MLLEEVIECKHALTKKRGRDRERKKWKGDLKEEKKERKKIMHASFHRAESIEENAHWLECKDDIPENGKKDGACWF